MANPMNGVQMPANAAPVLVNDAQNDPQPAANVVNGNSWSVYKIAKTYSGFLDTSMDVARKVVYAAGSMAQGFGSTLVDVYETGLSLRSVAGWAGGNELKKGWQALKDEWNKEDISIKHPERPEEEIAVVKAEPDMGKAIGVMLGHTAQALGKFTFAVGSAVGTTAWTVGTVSNYFDIRPASILGWHSSSKLLASGINQFASLAMSVGSTCTVAGAKVSAYVAETVYDNAHLSATVAATGTCFYYASKNFVKCVDANSKLDKIEHGLKAAAGLVATVAVPFLMYPISDESGPNPVKSVS